MLASAWCLSVLTLGCLTLGLWVASCFYVMELGGRAAHITFAGGDIEVRSGGSFGEKGFCASPPSPQHVELAFGGITLSAERVESLRRFGTLPYVGRGLFGQYWRFSVPLWLPLAVQALALALLVERRRRALARRGTCPKCGYLLYGLSEQRCPECGLRVRTRQPN